MARLPFNPEEMRGPERAGAGRDIPEGAIGVSELASRIDRALRSGLRERVRVVGEISGFADRTHWYFALKDEEAVVSCVMFAAAAAPGGIAPEDGQAVLATGRVEFYSRQGRTQLYVERMEPIGAGALEMRFRALCEELRGLGWFDPGRRRELPRFPGRVCVVTSATSAALQDVIDTARRRCPAVDIAVVDVRVQGASAAPEISRALRWISDHHESLGIDAIILTRGGGSAEDLGAFNEREVAKAVLECAVPVVAAIGHETDTTIAELVADERAATPTQASMRLTPDRASLHEQLDQLRARLRSHLVRQVRHDRGRLEGCIRRGLFAEPASVVARSARALDATEHRLRRAMRHDVARGRIRLERLGTRLARNRPEAIYSARRLRVDRVEHRLRHSMRARIEVFEPHQAVRELRRIIVRALRSRLDRLDSLERELIVVGPQHVLARGYSVTTGRDGCAIRSVREVRAGQSLETRIGDGSFRSTVEGAPEAGGTSDERPSVPLPPRRRRKRVTRHRDDPDQLGLF